MWRGGEFPAFTNFADAGWDGYPSVSAGGGEFYGYKKGSNNA